MYTRIAAGLLIWVTFPILAQNIDHAAEHGGQLYHRLQIDVSGGIAEHDKNLFDWELDGWIGSDENRLKIDSYGLYENGSSEQADKVESRRDLLEDPPTAIAKFEDDVRKLFPLCTQFFTNSQSA